MMVSRSREGAPLHVHSKEDEAFYVIDGSITVRCGEETLEAGPGSFVFLPRGIPHAREASSSEATVLLISVPAGFDEFMHELHQAGEVSDEVRDQIAGKYGITFLGTSAP
jgi:quercetin dioxygenase-like cupin family protein